MASSRAAFAGAAASFLPVNRWLMIADRFNSFSLSSLEIAVGSRTPWSQGYVSAICEARVQTGTSSVVPARPIGGGQRPCPAWPLVV